MLVALDASAIDGAERRAPSGSSALLHRRRKQCDQAKNRAEQLDCAATIDEFFQQTASLVESIGSDASSDRIGVLTPVPQLIINRQAAPEESQIVRGQRDER